MKHHGRNDEMQAELYIDRVQSWTKALEEREQRRSGTQVQTARQAIARRTGVSPGTLENIRNGRLKAIAAHVYDRLRAAVVADIEAELRHLQHELTIANQAGLDQRDDEVATAMAHLEKARQALTRD